MYISRCWLCWGVIDPIGSVLNLDMFSLFFVNKELLSCTQYIVSENVKESDCLHKVDITHFVIISLAYKQYWQLSLIFKCTYKIKKYSDSSDW